MTCIRVRRDRYVVDYRDLWGKRHGPTFPLTPEGLARAEDLEAGLKTLGPDAVPPNITLGSYIDYHWLPVLRRRVEPETVRSYEINARVHLPSALKRARLRDIRRAALKRLLIELGDDLAGTTVAKVATTIKSIFAAAVDDEVIEASPASEIARALGLRSFCPEKIAAMDTEQRNVFLVTAQVTEPARYLELATLAYAGLRMGEGRGLQLGDLDFTSRRIAVERQVHEDGAITPPKGRRGKRRTRQVDMADDLARLLEDHVVTRRAYDLRIGRRSPWLLYPEFSASPSRPQALNATQQLRRAMARVLEAAKLPEHFTPHSLRHTFARLLLEGGEDLLYVARQLGDTLKITADLYGQWAQVPSRAGGTNLLCVARRLDNVP